MILEQLLGAIIEHADLEKETIIDAGNYGADSGFGGFTYNKDCIEFYDANEGIVEEFARNEAESFGYKNSFEMVSNFNRSDMLEMGIDGYKVLMSWFVLEEVGRWLEDNPHEWGKEKED